MITCKEGVERNTVVRYLEEQKIQTRMLFAGNIIKHPCFDEMRKTKEGFRVVGKLDTTDKIMNRSFWLGVYPGITESMTDYIAEMLLKAL